MCIRQASPWVVVGAAGGQGYILNKNELGKCKVK